MAAADISSNQPRSPNLDPRSPGAPAGRNRDPGGGGGWVGQQVPQVRCAAVAQDCRFAAREERCLLESKRRWHAVPYEIDAPVNLVEAGALEPKLDLARRNAGLKELPARDNPVLFRGQCRDDAIRAPREGFTTHNVVNPAVDPNAPLMVRVLRVVRVLGAPVACLLEAPVQDALAVARDVVGPARDLERDGKG